MRVLKGDRVALGTLFDRHYGRVYRHCLSRVPAADAEEIAAETLRHAIRRIETYRGEAALSTWINRVARSVLSEHFRRTSRRPKLVSIDQNEQLRSEVEAMAADLDALEREQAAAERQSLVHHLLDALPGDYGDILEWKYIEGLSVDEIARKLSTTTLAVQSKLARARRAFKDRFDGTEWDLSTADGGTR
ncbi:MAG: sigma-70 family RNA polymerase sigma factor [Gammaproteobacteria bacterium]|nr:sigma-70 family RNA polymerase sigma factor [Gammaproteobacteria bacterium]